MDMASLPAASQIGGAHTAIYEAYYKQVDPTGTDHIGAIEAANFLKRSSLPDSVLSRVWDLSDSAGRGFLDRKSFYVALKLVALAQNGKELSLVNLSATTPPPRMVDPTVKVSADWSLKPNERTKYEEMFKALSPVNGKVPGNKVKPVMLNSKLPTDVLGKIWDLSDMDQDGALDQDEFVVAMHLIYKALENVVIPSVLPPELLPSSKRKKSLVGGVHVLPDLLPGLDGSVNLGKRSSTPTVDVTLKNALNKTSVPWVVSASDKAKFDELFHTLDMDQDGLVGGLDCKDTFLKTGLPQADLAHIWNLCDIKQNGQLNCEQFALAMYLVSEKMKGAPLPTSLLADMMPPSFRPKAEIALDTSASAVPLDGATNSTGNKELDMITEEIKSIQLDKTNLEQEISQIEADLKIKNAELKNVERESESVAAMLKQLDTQKKAALKHLSDLNGQIAASKKSLEDAKLQVQEETKRVDELKKQLESQQGNLEEKEKALESKKEELKGLCEEESRLEQEINQKKSELQGVTQAQQETSLQVKRMKLKISRLEEQQKQMQSNIGKIDNALSSGDLGGLGESILKDEPALNEPEYQHLSNTEGSSPVSFVSAQDEDVKDDPFKSKDPFSDMNGFLSDPFAGEDPFKDSDPFKGEDPFKSAFEAEAKADPFGSEANTNTVSGFPPSAGSNDPFDPFGLNKGFDSSTATAAATTGDPFGADPFQPVQQTRAESPTPALPPKKSKAPPPRPAPPKHLGGGPGKTGPTRAAPAPPPPPASFDPFGSAFGDNAARAVDDPFSSGNKDPFASSGGGSNSESFANFANFDKA